MTPEERKLVTELFDRLATLENAARDPDAERLISDGLRQAPNARLCAGADRAGAGRGAQARRTPASRSSKASSAADRAAATDGFLDSMRDSAARPSRLGAAVRPRRRRAWRAAGTSGMHGDADGDRPPASGQPAGYARRRLRAAHGKLRSRSSGAGGSFLGTAAAAAAGVIGGSLLSAASAR